MLQEIGASVKDNDLSSTSEEVESELPVLRHVASKRSPKVVVLASAFSQGGREAFCFRRSSGFDKKPNNRCVHLPSRLISTRQVQHVVG